jgi:deoxyribose-phosphate aldolase
MKNEILVKKIYSLIDLTSLNFNDTEATITQLCQQATSTLGHVAAVCIYPKFIPLAKKLLTNSDVKIATVVNFPEGSQSLATVVGDIQKAIKLGAQEIDVVMPYQEYLAKKYAEVKNFIHACKNACGEDVLLKVILETGALQQAAIISQASKDVILAGADFIKTSTGKINIGATLEAAEAMLTTIHDLKLNRAVGFKTSGGVRTIEQAKNYLMLAESIMGKNWISPQTFRIGASQLVKELF